MYIYIYILFFYCIFFFRQTSDLVFDVIVYFHCLSSCVIIISGIFHVIWFLDWRNPDEALDLFWIPKSGNLCASIRRNIIPLLKYRFVNYTENASLLYHRYLELTGLRFVSSAYSKYMIWVWIDFFLINWSSFSHDVMFHFRIFDYGSDRLSTRERLDADKWYDLIFVPIWNLLIRLRNQRRKKGWRDPAFK